MDWIKRVSPELPSPSLEDNRADADRVITGLQQALKSTCLTFPLDLMKKLPSFLRQHGYRIEVVLHRGTNRWHVIDFFPEGQKASIYGLAIDLGSSTIAVRLVDLQDHLVKEEISFLNPQVEIGEDILTRIHVATQGMGLERLQDLVLNRLNEHIQALTAKHDIKAERVSALCVAGNTTMTHFFLGLDPGGIFREPYIPAVNKVPLIRAGALGLAVNSRAPIFIFPNVGSYFGGDLIAGILASGFHRKKAVSILVDVGTNAEVVLGNEEWLVACAGAAGPALEGGVSSMGMMAGPGVIDKVAIDPGSGVWSIRTIGGGRPVGICGSGLIDLAAYLFLTGMIDQKGKFVKTRCGDRFGLREGIGHILIVSEVDSGTGKDLVLSQPEIDSLMRSKAAMYTILVTISRMVNLSFKDVHSFYLAGTFGTFIDPNSAITLGMIPDLPRTVYRPLGNSSLAGANRALLSVEDQLEVTDIQSKITYVELNVNQDFMSVFSAAKFIPHTDEALFPSVKIPDAF